ncbi:MAG: SPOR domain-containing protein [Gemmatimonadota bacterium]
MSFDIPQWTPFTPGFAPDLPVPVGEPGRVVGLIATEGALQRGWAAEVACGLAEAWSTRGLRMLLADAGLDHPTLHGELRISNDEGLAVALLWGASVKRVARAVRERGFYVVTAGTPVAADEDVANIAWDVLGMVRGVVGPESGTPFELNVPNLSAAEESGPDRAWGEAVTDVMRELAEPEPASTAEETEPTPEVPVPPAPDAPADGPVIPLTEPDVRDDGAVMDQEAARATETSSDAEGLVVSERDGPEGEPAAVPLTPPVSERTVGKGPPRRPDTSNQRRNVLLLILLMVMVGVVVAAWVGYVDIPGITPVPSDASSAPAQPMPEAGEPEVLPAAPTEVSAVLAYSLQIAAYGDRAEARERADVLSGAVPDVLFTVVPLEVSGRLYHRILAGPATDSAHAAAVATHVAEIVGLDPSQWVIRPTPSAFDFRETADRAAAERWAEDLREQGLPAYVLAIDYSDGSTAYRIYVGAYADEQEAAYLTNVLAERGFGLATFSHRTGRLPE